MKAQRASVLIVVLWATLGLVSISLLFGHSMLLAFRGADNEVAGHQADQAIEGAARYVQSLLTNPTTPGLFPDRLTYEREDVPVGEAEFWFLGRPADTSSVNTREFALVDEAGKLNLNSPIETPAEQRAFQTALESLPGMTAELAAAIIDWRDADDDITDGGAESETYQRLRPAYACKNKDFESIEELALVSGATREILYGEDANLNGVLDPNEDDGDKNLPADNSDGKLDPGILEYVTVFSRESNKQSDGTTARINISNITAVDAALRTLIDEKIGAARRPIFSRSFLPAGSR